MNHASYPQMMPVQSHRASPVEKLHELPVKADVSSVFVDFDRKHKTLFVIGSFIDMLAKCS